MTISLCMIVKNEELHIERCLKSVEGIVDEIIMVDTGSADATIDISKQYGAKLIRYAWNDDFSSARNVGLEVAQSDYILVLDADEELVPETKNKLKEILNSNSDGYVVRIKNFQDTSVVVSNVLRIFRNRSYHRFQYPIHEQVADSIRGKIEYSDLVINHYGYTTEEHIRKDKSNRNLRILENMRSFDNPYHLFQLAREYAKAGRFDDAYKIYPNVLQVIPRTATFLSDVVIYAMIAASKLGYSKDVHSLFDQYSPELWDYTQIHYIDGQIYEKECDYAKALERYRFVAITPANQNYTSLDVTDTLALYSIGKVYEEMEDIQTAYQYYQKSFSMAPRSENLFALVDLLGKDPNQFQQFIESVKNVVPLLDPNNLNALLFRLVENGHIESYRWLRLNHSNERVYNKMFDCMLSGDKEGMLSEFKTIGLSDAYQSIVSLQDGTFDVEHIRLPLNINLISVDELLRQTKVEFCLPILHQVAKWKGHQLALPYYIQLYQDGLFDAKSLVFLGNALRSRGDYEGGHHFYEKAFQDKPTSIGIFRLVESYLRVNLIEKAKPILDFGMEQFPESLLLQEVKKILI